MSPKMFLFFLLMPVFVPIALFFQLTYASWEGLDRKRVIFFLLLPIYAPLGVFMFYVFPWWTKLSE
ncbi:MAG: hypothetical protein M3Q73_02260 [bacterium]|nr:hypothetical protein [bacterium]